MRRSVSLPTPMKAKSGEPIEGLPGGTILMQGKGRRRRSSWTFRTPTRNWAIRTGGANTTGAGPGRPNGPDRTNSVKEAILATPLQRCTSTFERSSIVMGGVIEGVMDGVIEGIAGDMAVRPLSRSGEDPVDFVRPKSPTGAMIAMIPGTNCSTFSSASDGSSCQGV